MPGQTAPAALAVALMGAGVAAQSAAPDKRMPYVAVHDPVFVPASAAAFVAPLAAAINRAAIALEQAPGATPARPAVDPEARFEVASIKRFDPSGGAPRISMTPGRYDVAGLPLSPVVGQAVGVPADRTFGLPDWANTGLCTNCRQGS